MTDTLEKEAKTYEAHKAELLTKSEGKVVLIHGDQIVDIFDSENDALKAGYKQFGIVPLLVKKIQRFEPQITFTTHMLGL